MAFERGREFSRTAHAWGFMSRTMVSRDGARSGWDDSISCGFQELGLFYLAFCACFIVFCCIYCVHC